MKKKILLLPALILFVAIGVIFSCSKSKDSSAEDLSSNSKFKKDEWPTFVIPKEHLDKYFTNDISDKKIVVILHTNVNNAKNSMELVLFGGGQLALTITQDPIVKTTMLATKLGFGNNEISLNKISTICRINGQWINNFDYIRLTPVESTRYPGYLAFVLSACDKNGNIINLANPSERVLQDGESNPCPPACPPCDCCPAGTHQGGPWPCNDCIKNEP